MQWASSITKSPIRILRRCSCTSAVNSVSVATNTREALIKSARADSERFCFLRKFGKSRNTVCISDFPNCTEGAKDPLLSRRRFIQRFPRSSLPVSGARRMSPRRSFVRRLSTAQAQFFRCLELVLHQHKQRTDCHGHAPVLLPHQFCAGKIHQTFSPSRFFAPPGFFAWTSPPQSLHIARHGMPFPGRSACGLWAMPFHKNPSSLCEVY